MGICKTVGGKTPQTNAAAFVAENAALMGDVVLAENSSIWYGAVLRADTGKILIGKNANVQDNCVLHTGPQLSISVGEGTSIGHSAVVHGCTIGKDCLVGMHATILNGAQIGDGCIIAAGALVLENAVIPPHSLVVGVPGKIKGEVKPELTRFIAKNRQEYLELSKIHRNI